MIEATTAGEPALPVSPADRIVALDFIRGIAVLGILFPNVVAFAHPMLAYYWPEGLPGGATASDKWVWLAQFVLIDGKFRGLFTLLFGAGLVLFLERVDAKGGSPALQIRRLVWLALFGAAHMFLVWAGDILLLYAVAGFAALTMAYWPAAQQLRAGVAWFMAGSLAFSALLFSASPGGSIPAFPDPAPLSLEQAREGAWSALEDAAEEIEVTRNRSWPELVAWRLGDKGPALPSTLLILSLVETIPMMLVGMGLYRLGLFEGRLNRVRMRRWGWIGMIGGMALTVPLALWVMQAGFPLPLTEFVFNGPSTLLHLPIVIGLVSLLSLWAPRASQGWLGSRFVAAGRMAFSNYIGTSLLMMLVFQGWAGGLFGELHRIALLPLVLIAWILMLVWSKSWLARFRYGPLEWLWRCLTYGKFMDIRK